MVDCPLCAGARCPLCGNTGTVPQQYAVAYARHWDILQVMECAECGRRRYCLIDVQTGNGVCAECARMTV
jgi:hypothetical protein